jgi:hypothetical protein
MKCESQVRSPKCEENMTRSPLKNSGAKRFVPTGTSRVRSRKAESARDFTRTFTGLNSAPIRVARC